MLPLRQLRKGRGLRRELCFHPVAASGFTTYPWKGAETEQSCLICGLWKEAEGRGFVRGKEYTSQKERMEKDLLVSSHTVAFTADESLPHKDMSLEVPWVHWNAFLVLVL